MKHLTRLDPTEFKTVYCSTVLALSNSIGMLLKCPVPSQSQVWVFSYMGYICIRYVCGFKGYSFQPFWSEIGYRFWKIGLTSRVRFLHFNLEFGMLFRKTTFSSFSIRPSTKALQNVFNFGRT